MILRKGTKEIKKLLGIYRNDNSNLSGLIGGVLLQIMMEYH